MSRAVVGQSVHGVQTHMEHQTRGIEWMVARERAGKHSGGFLCDDMGLGKTVQMIGTMTQHKLPRTLVIVPVSLVYQWVEHVRSWSTLSVSCLGSGEDTEVVIATYSHCLQSSKLYGNLFEHVWDRVVLDEAHEVRNPRSKKFHTVMSLRGRIRWMMTGTLIVNSERDYKTLLRFLTHDEECLEQRRDIILKRTKKMVRLELPQLTFENIRLDPYPEESESYQALFRALGPIDEPKKVLKAIIKMRQAGIHPALVDPGYTGSSKRLDTLVDMITAYPDEKVLVFCHFKEEMKILKTRLSTTRVFTFHGGVPIQTRALRVKEFTECVGGAVFLIQIKAGSVGLNLQAATRVFITSPAWNPATELQAISRSHRIGQDRAVHVHKLFYSGLEEAIIQLQESKCHINATLFEDESLADELPMPLDLERALMSIHRFFCAPGVNDEATSTSAPRVAPRG